MQSAELPDNQSEHVHVAAHLNGTYGSLMLYTTAEEKGRVQERGTADTGNIIGYATYTVGNSQQPSVRSQRLSVSKRYTNASILQSADIEAIISSHRTADLVQLNGAFGWPDYTYLPVAEPVKPSEQLLKQIDASKVCSSAAAAAAAAIAAAAACMLLCHNPVLTREAASCASA